jgi:phosphate transport system substrate-binding protein
VAFLAVWTVFLIGCQGSGRPTVQVRITGAQIASELVQSWLEDARSHSFIVARAANPTWSAVGFDALADGVCDLACTDRAIEPQERARFDEGGVIGHPIAFYGYGLYVHPSNPVDSVFAGHLELIYQRQVKQWQELAGRAATDGPGEIRLYGPPKSSRGGMILARQARIFLDDPPWRVLRSSAEIVAAVAEDPAALGFAEIGFDDEVRYLGLRMERSAAPVFPSREAILRGDYGLARVIWVYHRTPAPAPAEQAVDFLRSPAADPLIRAAGLLPLAPDASEPADVR